MNINEMRILISCFHIVKNTSYHTEEGKTNRSYP